ncbi:MAG: DNA gyrase subunit B, partial [Gammaproteobacteria bacterium]|nr:DNA gyrase subunit B [Gammaproteobacteria bacterium]
ETLANEYMAVMAAIRRLARRYESELLEKMIYMSILDDAALQNTDAVAAWFKELVERVNAGLSSGQRYESEVRPGEEDQPFIAKLSKWTHGIVASDQSFSRDFFDSSEYEHIKTLGQQLDGLLSVGAYVQRGERREDVSSFKQALTWLMDEAKRGQSIQRYKGLGEMNPEQLWETTLDPENRRLLRVQIEDAVGSDDIFTTLMGDQVEPRRDFIEKNALSVSNLDI